MIIAVNPPAAKRVRATSQISIDIPKSLPMLALHESVGQAEIFE